MSPCDGNSHEEIPTETYQSYPGKASREPRGVEFTAPRRENGPKLWKCMEKDSVFASLRVVAVYEIFST